MRIILLFAFLLIACSLCVQSTQDRVTIDVSNSNLNDFIKAIEQKTKYTFIYGEDVKLENTIAISVKDKPIEELLAATFQDQQIDFKIEKSHILLTKTQISEAQPTKRRYTISGYVMDDTSRETMIGANVFDQSSGEGTATNEYGFFSLTIPEGRVELRFTYIGCKPEIREIDLDSNIEMKISLQPNELLKEVVIYGDKSETGVNATQMGAIDVPISIMKSTPALLGEADIMKTIQMMPGVQAGTEGSAGVYVRGGGSDENLILLDGVPLYNVDHLFGFFSVFTPDAVKKVSLFKGSFPARFGGRLSSVIDVRTNDGDMRKYHGTIGIGLLSSKFQFEGPISKDKTSFNISGRRSYIDLVAKPFMDKDDKFGYFFYDMNAKINHRFNDRSRLFISFYNGKDKLDTEFREKEENYITKDEVDLNWGNLLTAVRWNYLISPKLFSNTTIAYTGYKFNVDTKVERKLGSHDMDNSYSSKYSSGIRDWTYNMDFDYHPIPKHHIKFGAGYLYHCFKPEVQTAKIKYKGQEIQLDTIYNSLSNSKMYAHEANIYAEDNFDVGPRLSINAGLHFSLFSIKEKTYTSIQPRVSARYQLSDDFALKGAYTKMSQYIHLLSSYTITMPTDLWVPATKDVKPMQAHQYSVGGYYTGFKGLELSVEAYYKDMHDVLEYKDGASFLGSSHNWESKVEMGKGRAMGLEFMVQKTVGKTTGWVAYTLAKSDRVFSKDGINGGKRFPYRYDRRHHVSVTLSHKFSKKIDIGASWEFYTGGTTTLAEEKTLIIRPDGKPTSSGWNKGTIHEANYVENRNNYRMPSSHRLNLGINFNKKTKHGLSTWNVSVYNVYNAMNPTFLYKDTKTEDNGVSVTDKTILKKVTILPFIPSVSYTYKF